MDSRADANMGSTICLIWVRIPARLPIYHTALVLRQGSFYFSFQFPSSYRYYTLIVNEKYLKATTYGIP